MTFSELIIVGIILHLIGDFFLQSDWMAVNKASLRRKPQEASEPYKDSNGTIVIPRNAYKPKWWDRHPAAYMHAGIQGVIQLLIFPWWAALGIGAAHLIVDTRTPLTKWKEIFKQKIETQGWFWVTPDAPWESDPTKPGPSMDQRQYFGMGTHVAMWQDQTAHWTIILLAAILVSPW